MKTQDINRKPEVKVLVVDGDAGTRGSICKQLHQRGCAVMESEGFVQASRMVHGDLFDVVLIDLTSLKEEALLLIRVIKGVSITTQVILLIDPEQIHLSIKGMQLGAFDDVMVPVDIEKLWSVIGSALDQGSESGKHRGPGGPGDILGSSADRDDIQHI